jgi:hypothetical protein
MANGEKCPFMENEVKQIAKLVGVRMPTKEDEYIEFWRKYEACAKYISDIKCFINTAEKLIKQIQKWGKHGGANWETDLYIHKLTFDLLEKDIEIRNIFKGNKPMLAETIAYIHEHEKEEG